MIRAKLKTSAVRRSKTISRHKFDLRDYGVAARRGHIMSSLIARHPRTGQEFIYLAYSTASSALVVQVDPVSGACRQFDAAPNYWSPWGMIATPRH